MSFYRVKEKKSIHSGFKFKKTLVDEIETQIDKFKKAKSLWNTQAVFKNKVFSLRYPLPSCPYEIYTGVVERKFNIILEKPESLFKGFIAFRLQFLKSSGTIHIDWKNKSDSEDWWITPNPVYNEIAYNVNGGREIMGYLNGFDTSDWSEDREFSLHFSYDSHFHIFGFEWIIFSTQTWE